MQATKIVDNSDRGLAPLTKSSLRDQATTALREAIVSGRLAPGHRLTEVEVAEQFGISRAPVREALRQLEHEGLVRTLPYRQTEVLGVSQAEVVEVLVPIRLTLERFAFRKAQPLLSEADVRALEQLIARMRNSAADRDLDELAEADVRFHELVIERSGQVHCLQIWRSIEPRVRAYFRRDAPAHSSLEEVAESHVELLEALTGRDESVLLETLERHVLDYLAPSEPGPSG